jgi:hypothetical protein
MCGYWMSRAAAEDRIRLRPDRSRKNSGTVAKGMEIQSTSPRYR